jgi:hypothetical protein
LKPLAGNVNGSPNIAEIAMRTKKHNWTLGNTEWSTKRKSNSDFCINWY